MRLVCTILLIGAFSIGIKAQNYSVTPMPTIYVDTISAYKDYFFDITNNTSNQLALSWEITENTLINGWSYNVCDYQACYLQSGLPLFRDMDLIPANATAGVYLKLGIDPESIPGNGVIKFFLHETGNTTTGDTLVFDITHLGPNSLEELSAQELVNVYPNPANDYFTIEIQDEISSETIVRITNLMGVVVREFTMKGENTKTVSLNELASGNYIVTVQLSDRKVIKKLVVN